MAITKAAKADKREDPSTANYPKLQLRIGDRWKRADSQPVINPADESVLGIVPHATRQDLDDALAAAEEGFKVWSGTSPASAPKSSSAPCN